MRNLLWFCFWLSGAAALALEMLWMRSAGLVLGTTVHITATVLACYFAGGLVGTAILGQIFDRLGWRACVVGIAFALGVAAALTQRLKTDV